MPTLLIEGEVFIRKRKKRLQKKEEGENTMSAITKPGAFVLNGKMVKDFIGQNTKTSSDAIKRFEERKPKNGIVRTCKK